MLGTLTSDAAGAAAAAAVAAVVLALGFRIADHLPRAHPNRRSLHERPVPRVGGVAIWIGFVPVALLAPSPVQGTRAWMAGWAAVAMVSLLDDWRSVRASVRLAVHALAAAIAVLAVPGHGSVATGILAAALIVWAANLYNFMDGSDGLAAMMAVFGFGAYGVAALVAGAPAQAYFALAAATLPVLAANLPPARIFIGDVGAVPIGFLAGLFGFAGFSAGVWPAWFPLLVFLPFLADATLTLLRRLARGERVTEAHRNHYYQRLHRLGAGHRGTLLVYGFLMVVCALAALAALGYAPAYGWHVLGAATIAAAVFFAGIDYHWSRRRDSAP